MGPYRRNIGDRIRRHPHPHRKRSETDDQDDSGSWSDDQDYREIEVHVEGVRVETSEVFFHHDYRRTSEATSEAGVADVCEVEGIFETMAAHV